MYLGGTIVCKPSVQYVDEKDGQTKMSRARIDLEEKFTNTVSPRAIRALGKAIKDDKKFQAFVEQLEKVETDGNL